MGANKIFFVIFLVCISLHFYTFNSSRDFIRNKIKQVKPSLSEIYEDHSNRNLDLEILKISSNQKCSEKEIVSYNLVVDFT